MEACKNLMVETLQDGTQSLHQEKVVVQKEVAFRSLVERNQKKAFWMAYDILGNMEEAEDLSQDAFIRAYERWDSFRQESSIDTWFFRILINLCLSRKRRHGIWKRISDWLVQQPDEDLLSSRFLDADPERNIANQQSRKALEKALEQLSKGQRTAFVLRYLHDLSIKEIAEVTESAEGTIKSHLFRALKALKKTVPSLIQEEETSLS